MVRDRPGLRLRGAARCALLLLMLHACMGAEYALHGGMYGPAICVKRRLERGLLTGPCLGG